MPVVDAAREVLGIRLEAVELMLPLAAQDGAEEDEHVHQLRVASRRAVAALEAFRPCVCEERASKSIRRMKRIRRAAGEARDCDVQKPELRALRKKADAGGQKVLKQMLRWLDERRAEAQQHVVEASSRFPVKKLRRRRLRLLEAVKEPRDLAPAECDDGAQAVCFDRLSAFEVPRIEAAVRECAARDLSEFENLHELRLGVKRLRYAMEIFAPCLNGMFKRRYAVVQALQERLGAINDRHVLAGRIAEFVADRPLHGEDDALAAAAAGLIDHLRRLRDEESAAFLAEWSRGEWTDVLDLDVLAVASGGAGESGVRAGGA